MDIRWLCLVYIIMLFSINSQCVEQEDNFTDFMHNYTNLKIFLWSGSGDGSNEPTESTATTRIPFYPENPEDCIGGQDCNIQPTSVAPHPGVIDIPQTTEIPNKEYWIVTELNLRSPLDVNFSVPVIRTKLAVLYTIAFARRQARHLGLNWTDDEADSYRNRRRGSDGKPITVDVHILSVLNESDLVYFVAVNDRPVSAATAVRDMSLVTTQEAARHLGHAVRVKARPYLDALRSRRVRGVSYSEIWILVAVASVIVLVLVAGIVVAHTKKRRKNSVSSDATNMAFREHRNRNVKTEATSTEDINNVRTPEPKPRNRNKMSDSLLTMQAVNTFQKNSIPGPLTDVLDESNVNENKNMRTLSRHESTCGQDPGVVGPIVWDLHCKRMTIKSNERDDDDDDDDDSCSSLDAFNAADANVTKMRQKFHELLDDAFTLFGSRNSSLRSDKSSPSTSNNEQRSKSAPFRCSATSGGRPCGRPKTSADSVGGRDDDEHAASATAASSCWALSPGEAWAGSDRSVFVPRPLSAGPFHRPVLRAEFISSDASLSPRDPAVPLIKAIRDELDKFPPSADSSSRR